MKILALETSTLTGSVALLEDGVIRGEMTLSVSVVHSERLLPAVERLLTDAATPPESIDLFAVAVGPGSFTGLRIAIATVQGLCAALDKPAMGISTLQALACHGLFFPGLVVPMLDARRGEVYAGIYRNLGGKVPQIFGEELVLPPEALLQRLSDPGLAGAKVLVLGEGSQVYRDQINQALKGRGFFAPAPFQAPRAAHVAHLAWEQHKNGVAPDAMILPRYVRPAEVSYPVPTG